MTLGQKTSSSANGCLRLPVATNVEDPTIRNTVADKKGVEISKAFEALATADECTDARRMSQWEEVLDDVDSKLCEKVQEVPRKQEALLLQPCCNCSESPRVPASHQRLSESQDFLGFPRISYRFSWIFSDFHKLLQTATGNRQPSAD